MKPGILFLTSSVIGFAVGWLIVGPLIYKWMGLG